MGQQVASTAICQCTMGAAPAPLMVLPKSKVMAQSLPAANIMDHAPFMNIIPFGTCKSILCPTTAVLTAIAKKLTPGPCLPATPAPWAPGSPTVMVGGMPALNKDSVLACARGGVISIKAPGAMTVAIP